MPTFLLYGTPEGVINAPVLEWAEQHRKNLRAAHMGEDRHFLQEDNPHAIGRELSDWCKSF